MWITLAIGSFIFALIGWCACAVAGAADDADERSQQRSGEVRGVIKVRRHIGTEL